MPLRFTDRDVLTPEIRKRWLSVWQQSRDAHPFNHPSWFEAALMNGRRANRRLMIVSKRGRDTMVCAFQRSDRKLSLLGSPYLERSSMVICPDMTSTDWKEVLRHLLSKYDQILLQEIPRALSVELASIPLPGWRFSAQSSSSPYFQIEAPALSAKRRHELRRYTRKLDREHGPIRFECTPLEIEHIGLMADIERRSSKPEQRRSAFDLPEYIRFLQQVIESYVGMCWIGIMWLKDCPIAHYAGVAAQHRMVGLHMAFDMAYYRYSPGGVLIFNLLPFLEEAGIRIFDFGRGDSVLKSKFCGTQAEIQYSEYFFRKNPVGTAAWLKMRMLWKGISVGRYLRTLNHRKLNRVLDRFSIKR